MKIMHAAIGSVIGGVVGAGIWAAIAYFTGFEIGWIAVGVGALVGFGARLGAAGDTSSQTGLLAIVIAMLSIVGGKYAAVSLIVSKTMKEMGMSATSIPTTDELMIVDIADSVFWDEYDGTPKGAKLVWPNDISIDDAVCEADYPKELWADAKSRWVAMDAAAQEDYRENYRKTYREGFDQAMAMARKQAFFGSFALLDALFFVIAGAAAYKLGGPDRD